MKRATRHPELLPVVLARKEGDRRVTQHTPQEFHTGLLPKQHNCLADVLEGAVGEAHGAALSCIDSITAVPGDNGFLQPSVCLVEVAMHLSFNLGLTSPTEERVEDLDDRVSARLDCAAVAAVEYAAVDVPPSAADAEAIVASILEINAME